MPRRRANLAAAVGVLAACVVLVVESGGVATGASTATTTVSVTVASATSINAAGCASGTANVTDFGTVLPATSNVTSTDCTVVFGSSNDTSMLRAYQTDQAGSALFGLSNGALDATFDGDGKVTTPVLAGSDLAYDLALQGDGKIVLVGRAYNGANEDFAVVRYGTNGALDATFDTDGKVTTAIGGASDPAQAVAIQADGKIVVAGYSNNGTDDDVAIARYTTAGALDTTFDTDGMVVSALGTGDDAAFAIALQADGKIVVAGESYSGTITEMMVARYTTSGALDTTFDGDGFAIVDFGGGSGVASGVAIQPDGKIVAAGASNSTNFAVSRWTASGAADASFDGDGKVTTAFGGNASAGALSLQGDGKIVVGGTLMPGDFAAARYNTDGSLDTTFDTDGKTTIDVAAGTDSGASDMLVQADGRIVHVGYATVSGSYDFAALRYTTSGALDTTFDGDGKVTVPVSSVDYAEGAALQPDGKIAIGGSTVVGTFDFAAIRLAGGGSVADWSGSWGAANLFGACLHTVANATNTWTLAGNGNCTTAIDANWNALPTTASKIASAGSGVTNATTNLRYGFKATASQQAGTYVAPLTFEVVAPNA